MRETAAADRSGRRRPSVTNRPHAGHSIVLWRFRGKRDELRGLAIETSFGYAFGLELAGELVLFHLHRSLESMVEHADLAEAALIAQGWQAIEDRQEGRAHD